MEEKDKPQKKARSPRFSRKRPIRKRREENKDGIEEKVLLIKRVSKKTTGGNSISFTSLVVVGDKKGKVGIGYSRGLEVPQAIKKSIRYARNHMIQVPLINDTIPHDIRIKFKAAEILLKPAPRGAGLKAGSVVRSILSLAGVLNVSGKILRSRNQINNAYATFKALKKLKPRK